MAYQSSFGFHNFLEVWFKRIVCTVILTIALLKFEENPNGLTILIGIFLIALIRIKTEQLIVDDKTIVIRRRMFFDLFPIVTTIQKDKLKDIQIQGNRNMINNILLYLAPFGFSLKNKITFTLTSGRIRSFHTSIFLDELEWFKYYCKQGDTSL